MDIKLSQLFGVCLERQKEENELTSESRVQEIDSGYSIFLLSAHLQSINIVTEDDDLISSLLMIVD